MVDPRWWIPGDVPNSTALRKPPPTASTNDCNARTRRKFEFQINYIDGHFITIFMLADECQGSRLLKAVSGFNVL